MVMYCFRSYAHNLMVSGNKQEPTVVLGDLGASFVYPQNASGWCDTALTLRHLDPQRCASGCLDGLCLKLSHTDVTFTVLVGLHAVAAATLRSSS